jgi:hypothetical protein
MPDAPINAIKWIAMDFGAKRKNYKYRVKNGLHIRDGDTSESIIKATPNIEIFDAEDIESSIDTWLMAEDKVIISTNVTNYCYCMSLNFQQRMISYLFITKIM